MFKAVNAFAQMIRQVAAEDKPFLRESGLNFNIHCLLGGQMADDPAHSLYLIYPEGNWVEVSEETPYQIIGAPGYGKPILDRTFSSRDSLAFAVKVGCISFDSTRISAADVDFPIDVVMYRKNAFQIIQHRFAQDELADISTWWDDVLRRAIKDLPGEWIDRLMEQLHFDRNPG
jgi:putative proteasome-type protease